MRRVQDYLEGAGGGCFDVDPCWAGATPQPSPLTPIPLIISATCSKCDHQGLVYDAC